MVEMALWSKIISVSSTSSSADHHNAGGSGRSSSSSSSSSCCGLSRLMRKLKKQRKLLCPPSRQSSFQCRYDPMSYSLNFDTTGSGSLQLDEDYYKFCAFSSRFVATNTSTPRNDCQRLVPPMATSH